MANPRPAKHRVLGSTTVTTVTAPVHYPVAARTQLLLEQRQVVYQCNCCPAAARTKTISISVQSFA